MGASDGTCAFCAIDLEYSGQGRPPRFCSKRCRQGDYREAKGLVRLNLWRRARRRREARVDAELERLIDDADDWTSRERARDEALRRAQVAWPSDAGFESFEAYVAAQRPNGEFRRSAAASSTPADDESHVAIARDESAAAISSPRRRDGD